MAGLILLAALAVFIALLIWLSGLLTRWLPISSNGKAWLRVLIVVGAFPLMVVDEIVGKYQFEALCKSNGVASVNLKLIEGRRIRIHDNYFSWKKIPGMIIPFEETKTQIKDADTNRVIAEVNNYRSSGGWLMRHTALSMGSPRAILFGSATCDWSSIAELLQATNATLLKD